VTPCKHLFKNRLLGPKKNGKELIAFVVQT